MSAVNLRYDHSEKGLARRNRYNAKRRQKRVIVAEAQSTALPTIPQKPSLVLDIPAATSALRPQPQADLPKIIAGGLSDMRETRDMYLMVLAGQAKKLWKILDELESGEPSDLGALTRFSNLQTAVTNWLLKSTMQLQEFQRNAETFKSAFKSKPR